MSHLEVAGPAGLCFTSARTSRQPRAMVAFPPRAAHWCNLLFRSRADCETPGRSWMSRDLLDQFPLLHTQAASCEHGSRSSLIAIPAACNCLHMQPAFFNFLHAKVVDAACHLDCHTITLLPGVSCCLNTAIVFSTTLAFFVR
ncbi:hypothetical protein ACOSQ3_002821 [Xanthoceras sorbifolium]